MGKPEIRFKGYTDEWEQRKLGELVKEGILEAPLDGNHGEKHPTSDEYVESGIPFLMASDIHNGEVNIYSGVDDKYYKIFGTPYCKDFGCWAYMPGNAILPSVYSTIPKDVDILMCHDSPQVGYVANIMEHKSETYPNGIPAGNIYLFDEIVEKKPKYVLSGHIHSGDHTLQEYAGTKYANVSILDESYSIKYKPLTFEL